MADNETITVELPLDEDGFFSCQCPHCGDRFKLRADEFQAQEIDVLTCAICGLAGPADVFKMTDQVRKMAARKAQHLMADLIDEWADDMEREFRHGPIQFKKDRSPRKKPLPKLREIVDLADTDLPCCDANLRVPVSIATSTLYCPYCSNILA